ncbi:MAG: hypothetical protein ACR2H0_01005 [Candidatus Limnocylindrales bacterium]
MISNVIVHLINDLPILVDLDVLPAPTDRSIRCTNVRTVDGKRPSFIHDRHSTFVFPMSVVRLIEAPAEESEVSEDLSDSSAPLALSPPVAMDEEPDEDLLARIRSV